MQSISANQSRWYDECCSNSAGVMRVFTQILWTSLTWSNQRNHLLSFSMTINLTYQICLTPRRADSTFNDHSCQAGFQAGKDIFRVRSVLYSISSYVFKCNGYYKISQKISAFWKGICRQLSVIWWPLRKWFHQVYPWLESNSDPSLTTPMWIS